MLQPPDILLLEGNPADAALIIRAIRQNNAGYHIVHLQNIVQAVEFFFGPQRNQAFHLRAIVLALRLPGEGSLRLLRRLVADPFTKSIPLVVLVDSMEEPDIPQCEEIGVGRYLVKPVSAETLRWAMQ